MRLRDAMAFAEGQRGHELGFDAPHEVLRGVEGIGGEVELVMELAPRPEYGLITPLIRLEDGGARTFGSGRISVKLGQPEPESNLVVESNSSAPQPAQR